MKVLKYIDDKYLDIQTEYSDDKPKVREASRVVMFNDKNQIALTYTEKHGHHKLPGGGIESNETWQVAAVREALEEAGFNIKLREDKMIGRVIEERSCWNFVQVSYCAIADIVGEAKGTQLTESEKSQGYVEEAIWVTLPEALELFKNDQPKTYLGKYMRARDQAFLEEAIKVL